MLPLLVSEMDLIHPARSRGSGKRGVWHQTAEKILFWGPEALVGA